MGQLPIALSLCASAPTLTDRDVVTAHRTVQQRALHAPKGSTLLRLLDAIDQPLLVIR